MSAAVSGSPISASAAERVRAMIAQHGERAVLERFQLSRSALYRALSLLPVNPGTRALVHLALGESVEGASPKAATG